MKTIATFEDMKEAFGTYAEAARIIGMTPQAFNDAKNRKQLPTAKAFVQLSRLRERGFDAPLSLWGFEGQPEAAA